MFLASLRRGILPQQDLPGQVVSVQGLFLWSTAETSWDYCLISSTWLHAPAFFCPPKDLLWKCLLWQAWSCHPVVLAMHKPSVRWNPPGDLGWCQTIMYSFCSSTLKVQLILTISLPICNAAWGDFPSHCVLWQAELGPETFPSVIVWFNAIL